jgi:hypothetical protein
VIDAVEIWHKGAGVTWALIAYRAVADAVVCSASDEAFEITVSYYVFPHLCIYLQVPPLQSI